MSDSKKPKLLSKEAAAIETLVEEHIAFNIECGLEAGHNASFTVYGSDGKKYTVTVREKND